MSKKLPKAKHRLVFGSGAMMKALNPKPSPDVVGVRFDEVTSKAMMDLLGGEYSPGRFIKTLVKAYLAHHALGDGWNDRYLSILDPVNRDKGKLPASSASHSSTDDRERSDPREARSYSTNRNPAGRAAFRRERLADQAGGNK